MHFKHCWHLSLWALCAWPAQGLAQQEFAISGSLSLGLRHVSHADASGASTTQVSSSPDGVGALRFAASEQLSNTTRASFLLDMQVQADTGIAGAPAGLWNRHATLGLHGPWGNLTLGRQAGAAAALGPLALADPLYGNSGYLETTWAGAYTGLRFNNSLQYTAVAGQLFVGAMLALGEQAGTSGKGRTTSLAAGHQSRAGKFRLAIQESRDGSEHTARIYTLGGYHSVTSQWTLHAAYLSGHYERGFAMATSNPAGALFGSAFGLGLPLADAMRSRGHLLGLSWRASAPWTVKAALHQVRSERATFLSGVTGPGAGRQRLLYLVADYALSPRTSLQTGIDLNHWSGHWGGYWGSAAEQGTGLAANGRNTRTTYGSYLKHVF